LQNYGTSIAGTSNAW